MKTGRFKRLFMYALSSVALFFMRFGRKFTSLVSFDETEKVNSETPVHATKNTDPSKFGIVAELEVDGKPADSYKRKNPIYFDECRPYTDMEGVVTFRGDNLRSGAAYGTAELKQRRFGSVWSADTGCLKKSYGKGFWTGSGWTGQPLIVRWDAETRASMNLYEDKKNKDGLTEVIYSTMDGNVYFLDLDDGSRTRDIISCGMPFKGAGALDPRSGYPMLFLGAGDAGPEEGQYARSFCYNLTGQKKMFEFGANDPFKQRKFTGFDSSHLVHAETDTLLEPGENGIIYTMKLNSVRDENGGVHASPSEIVKLRYRTGRSSEQSYWLGMEDSAVCWKNYMYIADNGGNLFCVDLNTMKIIWTQDTVDDTNGSPVFSMEDGVPYLYIATSLHWTASRKLKLGDVPVFKINAVNGEYVWIRKYLCNTVAGISGGIQATCVLGRGDISDLVIFPIARTPSVMGGKLVALDKKTGREVWVLKQKHYAWSSPVAMYDSEGKSCIVICDSAGNMSLVEGRTGRVLDTVSLGVKKNIEASPAVFENTVVVGTRGQKIFGVKVL